MGIESDQAKNTISGRLDDDQEEAERDSAARWRTLISLGQERLSAVGAVSIDGARLIGGAEGRLPSSQLLAAPSQLTAATRSPKLRAASSFALRRAGIFTLLCTGPANYARRVRP
jgi:hypothetical protein